MDIKDLNKSQLILLAVLLSFITSIATGITTVTLMQQAPASVTTPINRVVQQTIEKIQQVEGKTTVQTVVIKEEDLIVDAIAKNKGAVFTVTKEGYDQSGNYGEVSAGLGFAVSQDGIIAVDAGNVPGSGTYFVKNSSGKFNASFVSTNAAGFSFLKTETAVNKQDKLVLFVPTAGDLNEMKTGQKVLLLGTGISSFIFDGLNANQGIDLSVSKQNAGGLVLNLDGDALGIALSSDTVSFASMKAINDALRVSSSSKIQ